MKKIILLLLFTVSCFSQTSYTVYDCTTLRALFVARYTEQPPCSTTAMVTQNWFKPTYNPTCDCFFNDATSEEQSNYEAAQQASNTSCEDMAAINDLITSAKSNAQLNVLYPCQLPGFVLTCPNLQYPGFANSETEYTKKNNGFWSKKPSFKNQ